MAKNGDGVFRVVRVKKRESLKSIYAKVRKAFSAADLQRFTVDEEMFPATELVAELEAIDKAVAQKRRLKKARR